MGISRFKVISVIFPRKDFKMEKLMAMLSYVLLVGIVVSLGINSKEELQKIAEWWSVEGAKRRSFLREE